MKHPAALSGELRASREHLTRITAGLDGDRLLGPKLAIVNPPLWELGHVAWFQEYWCLRRTTPDRIADSIVPGADALYDSATVAHDTRWGLPLLDLEATRSYRDTILERVVRRLEREPENLKLMYFAQLAIFHEDMHAEAFHYTRQTLGYEDPFEHSGSMGVSNKLNSPPARGGVPASPHPMPFPHAGEGNLEPPLSTRERGGGEGFAGGVVGAATGYVTTPRLPRLEGASGAVPHPPLLGKEGSEEGPVILSVAPRDDVSLPGGAFLLGAPPGGDFVFDNEKWAHEVKLAPFRIGRAPVTNADYLEFVLAGGYSRREWWDDDGWAWKSREGLQAPKYWTRRDDAWMQRRFDRVVAPRPNEPVIHVSWHEAQAWCRYANRRLPTEAEWEYAASLDPRARGKLHYPWGSQFPDAVHANLESAGVTAIEAYPGGDSASGCRQMIGNVWEWTESTFEPYPGFVIDPYKEYSEPWFGTHKVLRGGSFATTRRLIRNTWRNFYTPERYDVFAGFRTCAM